MVRLARSKKAENVEKARNVYRPAVFFGAWVMIVAGAGVIWSGDTQGKLMFQQQPGKMASAEALCEGEEAASFSILSIGNLNEGCEGVRHILTIPYVASYLGTGHFTGPESYLPGVYDVQEDYTARYGDTTASGEPVTYTPPLAVAYWSFRLMIGFAAFSAALALLALWMTRKGRVSDNVWLGRLGILALPMPFIACSFGWIFTEVGRQPWVVAPNPSGIDEVRLLTERGVSTAVPPEVILGSLIVLTLVYALLAVIWYRLMHRYTIEGVPDSVRDESPEAQSPDDADRPLSFAY